MLWQRVDIRGTRKFGTAGRGIRRACGARVDHRDSAEAMVLEESLRSFFLEDSRTHKQTQTHRGKCVVYRKLTVQKPTTGA